MAKSKFILQGFAPRNHIEAVRRLFEVDSLDRVILSVAFVNQGGVELLAPQIEPVGSKVTAYVGIRNPITSRQALARLLELGASLIAVDTGSPNVLFHPKLYFARGVKEARLVIGSANLTPGGLNNNVEAGMAIDLDLSSYDDSALADEIEKEFDDSLIKFPANLFAVETQATIQALQDANRIIDETAIRERSEAQKEAEAETGAETSGETSEGTNGSVAPIKLLVKPIRSPVRRTGGGAVSAAPATPVTPAVPVKPAPMRELPFEERYEQVWVSRPLTRRSLTIPTGPNSHPTGSTTLGKGQTNIDPVTYFREDVFGALDWADYTNRAGNPAERANAEFELYIDDEMVGTFALTLRHSSTRVAAAKRDKNLPTELSWNQARAYIMNDDLIGKAMTLYRNVTDPTQFAITIA